MPKLIPPVYEFGGKTGDPTNPQYSGIIAQGRDGNLYSTAPVPEGVIWNIAPQKEQRPPTGVAGKVGSSVGIFGQGFTGTKAVSFNDSQRLRRMAFDRHSVRPDRRSLTFEVTDRCAICGKPIMLEQSKVSADGKPLHERCFVTEIEGG